MEYEWDDIKEARNFRKHKLNFSAVEFFHWDKAVIVDRSRHEDGETRFAAISLYDGKVHTIIFTWREHRMRIISFRRANRTEEKTYGQAT